MPWNAKPDAGRLAAGIPKSNFWAADPRGVDQVGCVYTAQGFEYDYGGVIMGRDLVWREDKWVAQPSESRDPIVRHAENFDELVRHTYRVLLTRGLRGCTIDAVDRQTKEFLATLGLRPPSSL